MSRVLTPEEIEALLAGGPVPAPPERPRLGDPVEVLIDGRTVAYGHLVLEKGRVCVRIEALGNAPTAGETHRRAGAMNRPAKRRSR